METGPQNILYNMYALRVNYVVKIVSFIQQMIKMQNETVFCLFQ